MKKITVLLLLSALAAGCQTSSTQTNKLAPSAFQMLSGSAPPLPPAPVPSVNSLASLQEPAWDSVTRVVGTNRQIVVTHSNFTNATRVYVIGSFALPDTGILLMVNGSTQDQINNAVVRYYGTNRMWYTLPADTNRHEVKIK